MRTCLTLTLAALAALAGCADQKEVELLRERNDLLTTKLAQMDEQLRQARSQSAILQAANDTLRSDLTSSRSQVEMLTGELADAVADLRNERIKNGQLPPSPTPQPAGTQPPAPSPAPSPAPQPAPQTQPAADFDARLMKLAFTLSGDVGFAPGEAGLQDAAKAELDKVVATLAAQYPEGLIAVCGHTDADPIIHSNWKSNEALSAARAGAVAKYLIEKGVAAARLRVVGYGAQWPLGPQTTAEQKAANRRVEIRIEAKAE
jgi:flagellar motor protein MotB